MSNSKKTAVIERLFDTLFDHKKSQFKRTIVTATDLQDAKRFCKDNYGIDVNTDSNPFNFMKDIVRVKNPLSIWPEKLINLNIGGKQVTGDGNIFEFIHGGPDPFHALTEDYKPTTRTPEFELQSLTLPLASKELGRTDESWLLQVAVNLRVIETHFATGEKKQLDAIEISHLQMDIKLRRVQIDALYRMLYTNNDDKNSKAIITVEAKKGNERVLTEQMIRQVEASFIATDADIIVPVAIVSIKGEGIYAAEFKKVKRDKFKKEDGIDFHRDALYVLSPSVKGI